MVRRTTVEIKKKESILKKGESTRGSQKTALKKDAVPASKNYSLKKEEGKRGKRGAASGNKKIFSMQS